MLLCQGWAGFQALVDGADEESFEAADRFAATLAFGTFAFEVSACRRIDPCLCDRDAVERRVELAIAATVEPLSFDPA